MSVKLSYLFIRLPKFVNFKVFWVCRKGSTSYTEAVFRCTRHSLTDISGCIISKNKKGDKTKPALQGVLNTACVKWGSIDVIDQWLGFVCLAVPGV